MAITSHWDHFGVRAPQPGDAPDVDRIHNGAYDNASGCAAVLTMAQALTRAGGAPARSIYFVFTTAEESGLLGSEYFAAHPPLPMDRICRQHQRRRRQLPRPHERHRDARLRPLVAGHDVRASWRRARPRRGRRHPSRTRLLLPLRPLPAGQGRRAGAVAERAEAVRRARTPRRCWRSRRPTTARTTTSRRTSSSPSWDFSGAADDMKLLTALAWRIAATPTMPAYNDGDQFAQVAEEVMADARPRDARRHARGRRARARHRRCARR